jgi:hypothetical protein
MRAGMTVVREDRNGSEAADFGGTELKQKPRQFRRLLLC